MALRDHSHALKLDARGTYDPLKDSMSILLQPNGTELSRFPAIVEGPSTPINYNKELGLI